MHPNVHVSTSHNRQDMEQSKCPSTEEWTKKTWRCGTHVQWNNSHKKE